MADGPTKYILLLGAGFSRNWGGWLSYEVGQYLLGHKLIDNSIKEVLLRNLQQGFENALAELQNVSPTDSRLHAFMTALLEMFSDMDRGFRNCPWEFSQHRELSVSGFLTKFDVVFTLNQDTLLERYYLNDNVCLLSNARWNAYCLPGMQRKGSEESAFGDIAIWIPTPGDFVVPSGAQPYYKLHGSANWQTSDTRELLIMGGNKSRTLSASPLLRKYQDEFKNRLSQSNTKLMIIGYGFEDDHITKTIQDAVNEAGLKLFIIDLAGTAVLDKRRIGAQVYSPSDLLKDLFPSLIGVSSRLLSETFKVEGAEFRKLMNFFTS